MDSQIIDEVTEWESRSFSGGHAGLHDLADEGFTGAVSEGMAWLFMLNGKVVGVFDGSIDDFERASGTAYEAPHPSLPLLFAMQGTGGDTRAKYYTEDTPLSQVDDTLSSGGFTGYVKLSENVLSGDYYLVYHGGRSLACAFVGNSRQLLTGDEAFDRADDEVGIYEVVDVDVNIVDIPEDDSTGSAASAGAAAAGAEQGTAMGDVGTESGDIGTESGDTDAGQTDSVPGVSANDATESAETEDVAASADPTASEEARASEEQTTDDEPVPDDGLTSEPKSDSGAATDSEIESDSSAQSNEVESTSTGAESAASDAATSADMTASTDATAAEDSETSASSNAQQATADKLTRSAVERDSDVSPSGAASAASPTDTDAAASTESESSESDTDDSDVFSQEERWRRAKAIPSLDPSKSRTEPGTQGDREEQGSSSQQARTSESRTQQTRSQQARSQQSTRRSARQSTPKQAEQPEQQAQSGSESATPEVSQLRERLEEVQQAREEAEAAKERLAAEREELATERDELEEANNRLRDRIDELEAEVDRLENQLADVREQAGGVPEQTMAPQQALDGTNLFVRYDSKGGATLEKAHAGEVSREEAAQNLRLEHHTSFETEGLHVGGRPFDEFLRSTIEYGFVRWVVEDLLYEIRNTGNTHELDELFDAIPEIDRAELYGTVSIRYQDEGEEHREQQAFDVVLRDRMGNPLIVANLNNSREPATDDEMTSLVQTARRVKETSDSLGAAFYVTSSYFEPPALETAADATGGGLLNRGKRKSFVKLSRKQGFHLCLVETRDGNFHVNVPEL